MEDILLHIDSRYRNYSVYSSDTQFSYILNKQYKNIYSIKMISIELSSGIQFLNYDNISSKKQNNYFIIHIPNKLNDPSGTIIYIDDGYTRDIKILQTNINLKLDAFNKSIFITEKYFYIFYLLNTVNIYIHAELDTFVITLNFGWYSVYGLYNIISSYIINNNIIKIIRIDTFTLSIFDRRKLDTVRTDMITLSDSYTINSLSNLKEDLYKNYISNCQLSDTTDTTFIPSDTGLGILDKLYVLYENIYYINNNPIKTLRPSILNIQFNINDSTYKTFFTNLLNNYVYLNHLDDWEPLNNIIKKDIITFDINFSISNTELYYPSLGYILGFRTPNCTPTIFSLLSSSYNINQTIINGTELYNLFSNQFLLLKVNNWGCVDFNNELYLSKVIFSCHLPNNRIEQNINNEYIFRQPQNIQKLDIQLVDYLGNIIDLHGKFFSFTLQLKQIVNSNNKCIMETSNNIIFNK